MKNNNREKKGDLQEPTPADTMAILQIQTGH